MRAFLLAGGMLCAAPLIAQATAPEPAGDPAQLKKLDPLYQRANGCTAPAGAASGDMPLIDGLAKVRFPLSSTSARAQRYFDQGLALVYGFEYEKAEKSFARGAALDPDCAMCVWGQALAMGPYQNSGPMPADERVKAKALTAKVLASTRLNAVERALAEALDARYAAASPGDDALGVHGVAYAEALSKLADAHPDNDVLVVFAGQAAMEVRPWDYWQADDQTPLLWAARALKRIETVLARNPDQPQAQHLYIHLTEASTTPGKAEKAADMLEVAAPASAHLVHMPSHTFYRVGRFADAVEGNRRAIAVDDAMARRLGEAKPFYGYFRHHTHFIMSAAEQRGDAAGAIAAAEQLAAAFRESSPRGNDYAQALLATALQTRAQFATSADLASWPEPIAGQPVLRQVWRALRAEVLARDGKITEARAEIFQMRRERLRDKPEGALMPMVRIADHMAIGRINFATKNYRGAATRFARAAEIEAKIPYREPPIWHQPIDAALGAALLKAGDARGARAAFARAVAQRPGSPWVLWGRAQAEAATGDAAASAVTLAAVDKAWGGDRKWLVLERL